MTGQESEVSAVHGKQHGLFVGILLGPLSRETRMIFPWGKGRDLSREGSVTCFTGEGPGGWSNPPASAGFSDSFSLSYSTRLGATFWGTVS